MVYLFFMKSSDSLWYFCEFSLCGDVYERKLLLFLCCDTGMVVLERNIDHIDYVDYVLLSKNRNDKNTQSCLAILVRTCIDFH